MGTKNKHLFKRLGLFFSMGVLLVSTFAVMIPQSVSAKNVSDMSIYENLASATYYTSLSWCMTNAMQSPIKAKVEGSSTITPIKSWFNQSLNEKLSVYNPSSQSIVENQSCSAVMKSAMSLWGYANENAFLRDVNYTYNQEKLEWTSGSGWDAKVNGGRTPQAFWTAVQKKVYNQSFRIEAEGNNDWGAPILAEAEYVLLSNYSASICKVKNLGLVSTITDPTVKDLVTNGKSTGSGEDTIQYQSLEWLNPENGNIGNHGISYRTGNGGAGAAGNFKLYGNKVMSGGCKMLVERMSKLSYAFGAYNGREVCQKANIFAAFPNLSEGNLLAGCADGYMHKNVLDFCTKTYPTGGNSISDIRRVGCYFGQGNEAGEACRAEGFTSASLFKACIDGSKNKGEGKEQYCTLAYTRASPGSGETYEMKDEIEACKFGQSVPTSGFEIIPQQLQGTGPQCGVDQTATGCDIVETTCAVTGIGWMVCPVINFMATLGDSAYRVLADDFLQTNAGIVAMQDNNGNSNGTYVAWSIIRNVANVVFVIVFLFIIFSQLTGAGVSNYGVKKMLPRLIIGVILVNMSFIVSQLAVDVSNILGSSIDTVFKGVASEVNISYDRDDPIGSVTGDGNTLLGMFGTILSVAVVGVGGYFLLSAGGTLLVAALLGLLITLLILVIRQVVIVLAIVVAPLAFVAWILPNTESLFKQWLKIFSGMLALFPLVALIFGTATLASAVLGRIATDSDDMLWQLIAALLPAVSLLAVIPAIQGALKAVPGLGNMVGKLANRANSNLGSKFKKSYEGSTIGRGAAIRRAGRESYRNKRFADKVSKGGASQFFAKGIAVTKEGQAAQQSMVSAAVAAQHKAMAEEVDAQKAVIDSLNLEGRERQALAMGKAVVKNGRTYQGGDLQRAAIDTQMKIGNYEEVHEIVSNSGGSLAEHAQRIQNGLVTNGWGAKSPAFGGATLNEIAQGRVKSEADMNKAYLGAIDKGRFTAQALVGMDNDARDKLITAAKASSNPNHLKALKDAAKQIQETPELLGAMSGDLRKSAHIKEDLA